MNMAIARRIAHRARTVAGAFLSHARGQSMVEYALILVFIGVMGIVVLVVMGNQVHNVFNNVSCMLGTMGGSCP